MTFGRRRRHVVGLLSLIVLTTAGPALAHHSFAVFDHTRTVAVKGTVTKFQWTNPHAFLELDVPDDKGNVQPDRKSFIAQMGTNALFHYNAQQTWAIDASGRVSNVLA